MLNQTLTPQVLRPVAAPTDTFERPSAGRDLAQLAGALSDFAPSLARFAEVKNEEMSAKERIAGENKAREIQQQGLTYADAIKQGLIEPHQSPWFRLGAYETFGRVSGGHYADEMDLAFKQSDAAQSTDPKDFDAFEQKFRADWTKKNLGDQQDPYFQNAFGKTADSRVEGYRSNFAQQAGANLVKQNGEAFHAEVYQTITNAYNVVHAYGGKVDGQFIASQIKLAQDRQKAAGVDYKITNPLVASAIASAAKRFNDSSILDAMDSVKIGSGALAGTSYGGALREATENEIASVNQNKMVAQHQMEERQKDEAVNALTGGLAAALLKDPTTDIKPFIASIAKLDASKVDTFIGMQRAYIEREYQEDPETKRNLLVGIHTASPGQYGYTTQTKLDRALAAQSISPSTYAEYSSQLRTRDTQDNKVSKLFNDPVVMDMRKRVSDLFPKEADGSFKAEWALRAENALATVTDLALRYRQSPEGEKATAVQANEWINHQVGQQFNVYTDKSAAKDAAKIPSAEFGGKLADPTKHQASDPPVIFKLKSEFLQVQQKKVGKGLSAQSIALLQKYNIPNDPKAIEKFIADQMKLYVDTNP